MSPFDFIDANRGWWQNSAWQDPHWLRFCQVVFGLALVVGMMIVLMRVMAIAARQEGREPIQSRLWRQGRTTVMSLLPHIRDEISQRLHRRPS